MSDEALQQSLSAVMDNQADELELRRVLAASEQDPALRERWSRYQLARAALQREPLLAPAGFAERVSAALDDELPLRAPRPLLSSPWTRVAVAASVTLAVLAGVRAYNAADIDTSRQLAERRAPVLVLPQTQGPAVLAGYSTSSQLRPTESVMPGGWHEQRLPHYLRQHSQQAASDSGGALPYARAGSLGSH